MESNPQDPLYSLKAGAIGDCCLWSRRSKKKEEEGEEEEAEAEEELEEEEDGI